MSVYVSRRAMACPGFPQEEVSNKVIYTVTYMNMYMYIWTCAGTCMYIFGSMGRVKFLTHHSTSQGWALECPNHFVFVCTVRRWCVGSVFVSFLLFLHSYLNYVACYTRIGWAGANPPSHDKWRIFCIFIYMYIVQPTVDNRHAHATGQT